jgi:hypothetical protein
MIRAAQWTIIALAGCLWCLGCGDGSDDSSLSGSASRTYDLAFDHVVLQKQYMGGEWHSFNIKYVQLREGPQGEMKYNPVVLIANAPVEEGKKINLLENGATLSRVMPDAATFPDILEGSLTIEELGEPGQMSSGKFFITFDDNRKTTLDGEFAATLEKVGQ